nr:type I restriction endonuclease subunit S [Aerococcus sanguinicola]
MSWLKRAINQNFTGKSQFIEMFKKCNREKLGDYILQIRGVSYKPKDLSEGLKEGFVTLLRANNIANNVLNFEDVQFVSEGRVSDDQIIREGDILICASSGSLEHVGKAALCMPDMEYTFGAFCKLIRPIGKLYPEYIAGYMRTDAYRNTISDLAQGSNINNLRNEHINDLMIPIPSDEQQRDFIDFQRQSDKSK